MNAVDIQALELEYAKKINEELDITINTMAHDLKTPLTSVLGFSHQMLEKSLSSDSEDSNHLSKIYLNANYMRDLINSLMEFSRIGRAANFIEEIPLHEILSEVKLQLHYIIEQKDAVVNLADALPSINADKTKAIQLFLNLISNAIKFVPESRRPVVDVTCTDSGNRYEISVTDNGIGIDEKHIKHIFKVFHRENEIEVPGSGIGLAIVKKVADDQDFKISVKSKMGEGTTFTVSCKK